MTEGCIHILKLGDEIYSVTFAPYAGAGGALKPRDCHGIEKLRELLAEIGIDADTTAMAVKVAAEKKTASIPHVRLGPDEVTKLGF